MGEATKATEEGKGEGGEWKGRRGAGGDPQNGRKRKGRDAVCMALGKASESKQVRTKRKGEKRCKERCVEKQMDDKVK